ncbi:MAG TPA: hypothetical protein VL424_03610, partial [Pararobbsia sp.]|nr:hypothetical protein [Pararobbsia sp.]
MKIMRGANAVPVRRRYPGASPDVITASTPMMHRVGPAAHLDIQRRMPFTTLPRTLGNIACRSAALWVLTAAAGTLSMPAAIAPITVAHAQAGAAAHVKNPVLDGTPEIDASIANHDWAQALAQLDEHLKTHPIDAQAKFKRATVLARMGRDDDAISA